MAQVKVDKDRSYRLGKGKALDAYNERLAEEYHERPKKLRRIHEMFPSLHRMYQLHPTKGGRSISHARLMREGALEAAFHGWAALAAKITGSRVGGEPRYGTGRQRARLPHQGARECARRQRQMRAQT